jgi:tetratricopeptide (TPR) repeat protein
MATYKKRGYKKSIPTDTNDKVEMESTTAEVFETLDSTASRTEEWISRYQNFILTAVGLIALSVLSYLGYQNYIFEPKKTEAVSELSQAQYYFELAVNGQESDSLFRRALNGGEGKYGFLDIIDNYAGTPAAKLATYSAGMAYLNLGDYVNAIAYLDQFDTDDVMLKALAKGAIGDAFAEIDQPQEAYDYYVAALEDSDNTFSAPKYLFKAGLLGASLGKNKAAIGYFKRIQSNYPESAEARKVEVQIGRLENLD